MASSGIGGTVDPTELRGRPAPWGRAGALFLAACVLVAWWLRLRGLAAEGFADDEVHKWLAANRYLTGDFGGDDVEHPMLMKSLVAVAMWALRGALAPETLTRLPSAVAGGLTVFAVALLGRRLFGRAVALSAAALLAVSTTAVGYHRIAKEDTLFGLFFTLCFWCFAEAKAAADDGRVQDQKRWEVWSAAALGAAFASKYFVFYCFIPPLAYISLRPVSSWRGPLRRWAFLIGVALVAWVSLNWTLLLPSTWHYWGRYIRGDQVGGDRAVSESLVFMGRLYGNMALAWRGATPLWFYQSFFAVKFAPLTVALGAAGLALAIRRRAPAHRILLVWLGVWQFFVLFMAAKYARFFVSAMPAVVLLAASAAMELSGAAGAWLARHTGPMRWGPRLAMGGAALLVVAPEAVAAVRHAPHYRLYVSALGGGDRNVSQAFPHCDYFDVGIREAVAWVARRAEPGAEVASEVDWSVRLYAERDGRADLVSSPILPGRGCHLGRACYVLVQPGRIYWHNQAALERLAATDPVHVEHIRDGDAVRVYRLGPGEALFGPAPPVAASLASP